MICSRCRHDLAPEMFAGRGTSRQYYCRACASDYARDYHARRPRAEVSPRVAEVLRLLYREPATTFAVARVWTGGVERRDYARAADLMRRLVRGGLVVRAVLRAPNPVGCGDTYGVAWRLTDAGRELAARVLPSRDQARQIASA